MARPDPAEAVRGRRRPRRTHREAGDAELLPASRRLVDGRPTRGRRRLAALLGRERRVRGEPPVDGERVPRVPRAAGPASQARTARRPGRTRDGAAAALRPDVRWRSDRLDIAGRDGGIVRAPSAIDARDRESLGRRVAAAGISGEMARDLMVACVEGRFGATRTARAVERLSDNGSAYRAKETLETATALGLRLAFTPVRSPEGDGIAEAFVKTLERDYARVALLPDARTILGLVPAWIEGHNASHPHSGPRTLSPREFRARCA